jgi:hypothetical protein
MRAFWIRSERLTPYRLLGLAILVALALGQLAGLVMLARSQVQKAELRAIAERSVRWEAANCFEKDAHSTSVACSVRAAGRGVDDGLIAASYAPSR